MIQHIGSWCECCNLLTFAVRSAFFSFYCKFSCGYRDEAERVVYIKPPSEFSAEVQIRDFLFHRPICYLYYLSSWLCIDVPKLLCETWAILGYNGVTLPSLIPKGSQWLQWKFHCALKKLCNALLILSEIVNRNP